MPEGVSEDILHKYILMTHERHTYRYIPVSIITGIALTSNFEISYVSNNSEQSYDDAFLFIRSPTQTVLS